MKLLNIAFILIVTLSTSCQGQEKNKPTLLNYKAQTRGFLYDIHLENDSIQVTTNSEIKKATLTKNQLIKIDSLLGNINFKEIKNNISTNDLAVDKAIKGVFNLEFNGNSYTFDFNHHTLPNEIEEFIKTLEEFTN